MAHAQGPGSLLGTGLPNSSPSHYYFNAMKSYHRSSAGLLDPVAFPDYVAGNNSARGPRPLSGPMFRAN